VRRRGRPVKDGPFGFEALLFADCLGFRGRLLFRATHFFFSALCSFPLWQQRCACLRDNLVVTGYVGQQVVALSSCGFLRGRMTCFRKECRESSSVRFLVKPPVPSPPFCQSWASSDFAKPCAGKAARQLCDSERKQTAPRYAQLHRSKLRLHAFEHVGQKSVPEANVCFAFLFDSGFFRLPLEPLFLLLL